MHDIKQLQSQINQLLKDIASVGLLLPGTNTTTIEKAVSSTATVLKAPAPGTGAGS